MSNTNLMHHLEQAKHHLNEARSQFNPEFNVPLDGEINSLLDDIKFYSQCVINTKTRHDFQHQVRAEVFKTLSVEDAHMRWNSILTHGPLPITGPLFEKIDDNMLLEVQLYPQSAQVPDDSGHYDDYYFYGNPSLAVWNIEVVRAYLKQRLSLPDSLVNEVTDKVLEKLTHELFEELLLPFELEWKINDGTLDTDSTYSVICNPAFGGINNDEDTEESTNAPAIPFSPKAYTKAQLADDRY